MQKTIIAIGYGRTSSENVGAKNSSKEKISVSVQRADFETACSKNGWQNGGWYEDRDITGRAYPAGADIAELDTITAEYVEHKPASKRERKGLADALKQAEKVGASILWVRDETRFYRPLENSMLAPYLIGELKRLNLTLWSSESGKIDFENFSTSLVQNLMNLIKSRDIKIKTSQSMASKRAKQNNGFLLNSSANCYGWRSDGKQRVRAIPDEQATVKDIFQRYISGQSVNQICRHLSSTNVPTYKKGGEWGRQSIRQILTRPIYCGMSKNSDGDLIPSKVFPPIISRADYNKALERLAHSRKTHGSKERKYVHPLVGLIRCGVCGSIMRPRQQQHFDNKQRMTFYFYCPMCYQHKAPNMVIRESVSDLSIMGESRYLGIHRDDKRGVGLVETLYPFTLAGYIKQLSTQDATPELLQQKETIKLEIEHLEQKITQRYKDYEDCILPRESYIQLSHDGKEQKEALINKLSDLEQQINASASKAHLTATDAARLQDMSASDYTSLLREVVREVISYYDRLEIIPVDDDGSEKIVLPRCKGSYLPAPEIILGSNFNNASLNQKTIVRYHYPAGTAKPTTVAVQGYISVEVTDTPMPQTTLKAKPIQALFLAKEHRIQ